MSRPSQVYASHYPHLEDVVIPVGNAMTRGEAKMVVFTTLFMLSLRTLPVVVKYQGRKLLFIQPPKSNNR